MYLLTGTLVYDAYTPNCDTGKYKIKVLLDDEHKFVRYLEYFVVTHWDRCNYVSEDKSRIMSDILGGRTQVMHSSSRGNIWTFENKHPPAIIEGPILRPTPPYDPRSFTACEGGDEDAILDLMEGLRAGSEIGFFATPMISVYRPDNLRALCLLSGVVYPMTDFCDGGSFFDVEDDDDDDEPDYSDDQ